MSHVGVWHAVVFPPIYIDEMIGSPPAAWTLLKCETAVESVMQLGRGQGSCQSEEEARAGEFGPAGAALFGLFVSSRCSVRQPGLDRAREEAVATAGLDASSIDAAIRMYDSLVAFTQRQQQQPPQLWWWPGSWLQQQQQQGGDGKLVCAAPHFWGSFEQAAYLTMLARAVCFPATLNPMALVLLDPSVPTGDEARVHVVMARSVAAAVMWCKRSGQGLPGVRSRVSAKVCHTSWRSADEQKLAQLFKRRSHPAF
jgi:hypothetical protein